MLPEPPCGNRFLYLLLVITGASLAYAVAHRQAFINPYVINDDVRQQITWMQIWTDAELFPDDLLSRYARSYVPWGVQAIYACASPFMNPVQFTKVVAGVLFVTNAGFLYGLSLAFRDERTAVVIVCVSLFFTTFLMKISGGISQSFAFPLLSAYLFFLDRNRMGFAAMVILLQSLLNPYIFLLCLTTHSIFLARQHGRDILKRLTKTEAKPAMGALKLLKPHLPIFPAMLLAVLHVALKPDEFGRIVTRADMGNQIEYTAQGRYPILPCPSLAHELIRPVVSFFPFQELGPIAGWSTVAAAVTVGCFALLHITRKANLRPLDFEGMHPAGFRVFAYLLPASLLLYGASSLLLMRLFLPERYIEFSIQLFTCSVLGVCISFLIQNTRGRRKIFPLVALLFMLLGGLRLSHTGIYDYSANAPLCRFLEAIPKNSLVAGHPELMDNVVTFARRKAFVTYELSHTWYTLYWDIIRNRTFELFRAYYSSDPQVIREFCRGNTIDYLVVRDEDFLSERVRQGRVYFEPFGEYITNLTRSSKGYAILDTTLFPPVYHSHGIRVLKVD